MDCGIPFCHQGCPLGNLIPDWNDLVYRDRWRAAIDRLHATNNFPEFTGRLCPAPCEGVVRARHQRRPGHHQVDRVVDHRARVRRRLDRAAAAGDAHGKKVAVVGSGPAGLAAADQLNRAGHAVTVFESADRIGGLLRYGIPEFKMEKRVLDRRLELMEAEGVVFRPGVNVGVDVPARRAAPRLRRGAPGRRRRASRAICRCRAASCAGIHFAMEYLTQQNRRCEGDADCRRRVHLAPKASTSSSSAAATPAPTASARRTARARSRCTSSSCCRGRRTSAPPDNPWPLWPLIFRISSAHEEGGERLYSVSTQQLHRRPPRGACSALHAVKVEPVQQGRPHRRSSRCRAASSRSRPTWCCWRWASSARSADALLDGPRREADRRAATSWRDATWMTSVPGVFAAGDMQRGQSLIVWAIAEGRSAARGVDRVPDGPVQLPAPVS